MIVLQKIIHIYIIVRRCRLLDNMFHCYYVSRSHATDPKAQSAYMHEKHPEAGYLNDQMVNPLQITPCLILNNYYEWDFYLLQQSTSVI